jgi:formiminotetrahydrofolate cyclodeaminase
MGLIQMVGRISLKRKKKTGLTPEEDRKEDERRDKIQKIIESVEKTKRDAFKIVDIDPEAYQKVLQCSGQPEQVEAALKEAFQIQAELGFLIVMARRWNEQMKGLVSGSIKNDLLVSDNLFNAAFEGAYHTAHINVVYLKDESEKRKAEDALAELKKNHDKEKSNARP